MNEKETEKEEGGEEKILLLSFACIFYLDICLSVIICKSSLLTHIVTLFLHLSHKYFIPSYCLIF